MDDDMAAGETVQELLDLTQQLLDSIAEADWATYERLCDPTLSAFEPEARGHLIDGMEFHRFYFDLGGEASARKATISSPHVRLLGDDAAVVSYIRLVQYLAADGEPQTSRFEETRVWERQDGVWRHVHFHRSENR
jgi:calcium/calmodulin-dependent protein kinase (CaM kinase) II